MTSLDHTPAPLASQRHTFRFLLISIGIALASFIQAHQPGAAHPANRIPLYAGLVAVELLLVWFVRLGVRARGGTLADVIGLRWRSWLDVLRDLVLAAAAIVAIAACSVALVYILGRWRMTTAWLLPQTPAERVAWIVVAVAAGVCEELVYRGYLLRQLWSWSRSLLIAILLQAIIFGAAHVYQGWRAAIVTGSYGLVFALLAGWRRSVIPGMIAHAAIDIIGGLARH